jgi:hypothetical protein
MPDKSLHSVISDVTQDPSAAMKGCTELVLEYGGERYHWGHTETFNCGCIQDLLLGIALNHLCEGGLLDPLAPVREYLGKLHFGGQMQGEPRVVDILSHSTGYEDPSPEATSSGAVSLDLEGLFNFLASSSAAFPPGFIVSYGLLSRLLMTAMINTVAGRSPYLLIQEVFDGLNIGSFASSDLTPQFGACDYLASSAEIMTLLSHIPTRASGWLRRLSDQSSFVPLAPNSTKRGLGFPQGMGWGAESFGNDVFGQSGVAPGFMRGNDFIMMQFSLRFGLDADFRTFGAFRTYYEREKLISEICQRVASVEMGLDNGVVGFLGSYTPSEVAGLYRGPSGRMAQLSDNDGKLKFTFTIGDQQIANIFMDYDGGGTLTNRFRMQGIFTQFFSHPVTGGVCFQLGARPYVKE